MYCTDGVKNKPINLTGFSHIFNVNLNTELKDFSDKIGIHKEKKKLPTVS